jgi:hypothetical protein
LNFDPIDRVGCPSSRFWDLGKHRASPSRVALFLSMPIAFLAAIPARSQTAPSAPASTTTPAPTSTSAPASTPDQQPHGQVIFSRSVDENGQTTSTAGPAAPKTAGQPVTSPVATDDEREALTFTSFDVDVHLRPAAQQIAVRAQLTVENDGHAPLAHIPLQISSSLDWETIRLAGHDVAFTVATLNSDVDHTGQLHEAAIALASPLAPGATLQLDVTYSGTIPQSAQRLITIGTPDDAAAHTDWDSITIDFTGLRGFGNVVWYPVSSVPVILGDGARVFDEMGEHKLRMAGAHFRLALTDEFPHGQAPTVALINGHRVPLTLTEPSSAGPDVPDVASASLDQPALGFEAPSLFLAVRNSHQATNTALYTVPEDDSAVEGWASAAAFVTPFLQGWLGQSPRSQLTVLDLPDPDDAPFETGPLLVTAIRPATPDELDGVFAHALTHAYLSTSTSSPAAWLSEGVAQFMGSLWLERQQGRQKALESLESGRAALALAEPASPGESSGQPLAQAISPVYYRTKATYIFWMLRDLAGDAALSAALRAFNPTAEAPEAKAAAAGAPASTATLGVIPTSSSNYFEKLIEDAVDNRGESSSLGQQANPRRDLSWFFSDWVDADKGLPDIAIDSVFPSHTEGDNWLVAVNLSNSGYAAADIPVTVGNAATSVTERVVLPARGKATLRILLQGQPIQVQANDGTVPETEASVHIRNLDATDNSGSSSSSPAAVPQ